MNKRRIDIVEVEEEATAEKRKSARMQHLKKIIFTTLKHLGWLLIWTLSFLLIFLIVADPATGTKAFIEVLELALALIVSLFFINLILFILKYFSKDKKYGVYKTIPEDKTDKE